MSLEKLVPVDGEKLSAEFVKRNLSWAHVQEDLGRAPGFISKICRRGSATKPTVKQFEILYNIRYEDIKPDPPKPEPEPEVKAPEPVNNGPTVAVPLEKVLDELKDLIYNAVYQAVKDAWEDAPTLEEEQDNTGVLNGVPYI